MLLQVFVERKLKQRSTITIFQYKGYVRRFRVWESSSWIVIGIANHKFIYTYALAQARSQKICLCYV